MPLATPGQHRHPEYSVSPTYAPLPSHYVAPPGYDLVPQQRVVVSPSRVTSVPASYVSLSPQRAYVASPGYDLVPHHARHVVISPSRAAYAVSPTRVVYDSPSRVSHVAYGSPARMY